MTIIICIYIYTHYISSVCVCIYIYTYLHMYTVYTQKKKLHYMVTWFLETVPCLDSNMSAASVQRLHRPFTSSAMRPPLVGFKLLRCFIGISWARLEQILCIPMWLNICGKICGIYLRICICIYNIWYDIIYHMIWYDMIYNIWYVICDMIWYDILYMIYYIWYIIYDMWYVIRDTWYVIRDTWYDMIWYHMIWYV